MEADLGIHNAVGWLHLLAGLGVFLLPGLAIADRVLPQRVHLLTAPIWSFSILPLMAILLDFAFGVPINGWTAGTIALGLAWWLGWRRTVQAWRWATGTARFAARRRVSLRRRLRKAAALAAIAGFLMLVHGLPHVPGDAPEDRSSGPWDAYPSLARRAVDAVQGDQYPYPVHVDTHKHMARMAQVEREGSADIIDPYTGGRFSSDLFTVQGMRSERGFDVAIVQLHDLTGLSLWAVARFLPAIWAGFLGITLWLTLRPAPGAVAAAALVAVLPTTVRFLGVGFLVPSAFALPWFLLALLVSQRSNGAGRFFGLLLVVTAAHFMHLVLGFLSVVAAVIGTWMRDDRAGTRLSMSIAALVPLLWIVPATLADARAAISREHDLPFETQLFAGPGVALYVLAMAGTALAFAFPARHNQPHRALALLLIPMTMSLAWSVRFDHHSDATYSRQVFAFFLSAAALASYGLADGLRRLWVVALAAHARWRKRRGSSIPAPLRPAWRHALVAAIVAVMLAAPVHGHLERPFYRVHDQGSWQAAHTLAASNVGPEDVFLSHPWQAPLYNSVSGALPYTVLLAGSPPERGQDWDFYLRSGGADADWLQERGITIVVSATVPNAPHQALGPGVYRVV